MMDERQSQLLKLIVEEYVKTAKPVGSKVLTNKLKCSSATIRNEMSYLEELGLLEKTHTSSGRVPSEKGYHYYVDHIMRPRELTGEDMLKLQTIFKNKSLVLSDAIELSMEIVSDITNYTTIVLGKSSDQNRVNRVEVVPLDADHIIAVIVTDKGHVEHKSMHLAEHVSAEEVKKTVELINKLIVGTPLTEVSSKLEFEVKPVIAKVVKQHDVLYNAFYDVFNEFAMDVDVKMVGANNILKAPEFNDADKIKALLPKFDQESIVDKIQTDDEGIKLYIGKENEFDDDVTVIKTKYKKGDTEGTLALIGPKRMDYDRVLALLDFVKKNIEKGE